MLRRNLIIFLILAPLTLSSAQSKLEIQITDLKNNKGYVAVELIDKNNHSLKGAKKRITDKKCTFVFNDLSNDKYAIRFFHDENSNEKIDKNLIGIPKEGFGLSNNGLGKFGPKKFDKWLFSVSGDTIVFLKPKYY